MAPEFTGSVAEVYARSMAPMWFEPYAKDLVARLAGFAGSRVLEIAAGTGVVTRALAEALAPSVEIVATDLNAAMIDRAAATPIARPVTWRVADALALPFDDGAFDLVVCQFGVMFLPDKVRGYSEMRRVLAPGGRALVTTWDRLGPNELAACVQEALDERLGTDSPRFFARVPHGYYEPDAIRADVTAAGFAAPRIEIVTLPCRADSARDVAIAMCLGTPLRHDIETRGLDLVDAVAAHIAKRFGTGAIDAKMQALVIDAAR